MGKPTPHTEPAAQAYQKRKQMQVLLPTQAKLVEKKRRGDLIKSVKQTHSCTILVLEPKDTACPER